MKKKTSTKKVAKRTRSAKAPKKAAAKKPAIKTDAKPKRISALDAAAEVRYSLTPATRHGDSAGRTLL